MDSKGSHADLSKFTQDNYNTGLTDRELTTIDIKNLNSIIKYKGKNINYVITNTKYMNWKVYHKKKKKTSGKRGGLFRTGDMHKQHVTIKIRRLRISQERKLNCR